MNKKLILGALKNFSFWASLLIFSFIYINFPANLFANPEPIPISGTPKLNNQNPSLKLGYDIKSRILFEKNTNQEYDETLDPDFWAYDFEKNQYYQIQAILKNQHYNSFYGYYLYIYLEKDLADRQVVSDTVIQNIRDEFTSNIYPHLNIYFGKPPANNFTILILDIKDDYNPAIGNTTYVSGYFDYNY
ncbi:MAG: hypothetical protein ACPL5I_16450, partial [Thermodesulfobacteriota bacterium]